MTDDVFLAEIAAAPDDDRPRLVYADHLMQRGDARGELIALQCELERKDAADEDVRRLARSVAALLDQHGGAWSHDVRALLGDAAGVVFHRGFVEEVHVDARGFVAAGPALPVLVRRLTTRGGIAALATSPHAARLVDVLMSLRHFDRLDDLVALASSPHLAGVRRLGLVDCAPEAAHLLAIAATPHRVEELVFDVDGSRFPRPDPAGLVDALCARADLRRLTIRQARNLGDVSGLRAVPLEQVTLSNVDLTAGAAGLVQPRLVSLDLDDDRAWLGAGFDTAAVLASAPNLRRLRLARLGLGDRQAIAIAETPNQLRRLDLARNVINDPGALALARSPHLRGLLSLNLNANRIGDAGKAALRDAFPDAHLQLR